MREQGTGHCPAGIDKKIISNVLKNLRRRDTDLSPVPTLVPILLRQEPGMFFALVFTAITSDMLLFVIYETSVNLLLKIFIFFPPYWIYSMY